MATTYPFGYGTARLTRAQLEAKETVYKLEPEFWRRTIALMEYAATKGVSLGVGDGWRIQPDPPPPGFAKPGNSNHEGFAPNARDAVAIDMVPDTSWAWMENNCAAYGLRTFRDVNNEPWHIQPSEIPASRNWRVERWFLAKYPLPGTTPPPTPIPTESDDDMLRAAKDKDHGNAWYYGPVNGKAVWLDAKDKKGCNLLIAPGLVDVGSEKVVKNWDGVTPIPDEQIRKYIGPSNKGTF